MKKLILILLMSISFAIDPITPVFHTMGADNSQIGHFFAGKTFSEWLEEQETVTDETGEAAIARIKKEY